MVKVVSGVLLILAVRALQYQNLGQNIWILFHFLEQFLFTTSETELDYYHQKVKCTSC